MNRSEAPGFLAWFLFGGMVGTAVGMLLAPKAGRETRHLLTEKGEHVARRAQNLTAGVQQRASDWLGRGRAGDWLDQGREAIEQQARRLATAFEPTGEAGPEPSGGSRGQAESRPDASRAKPGESEKPRRG